MDHQQLEYIAEFLSLEREAERFVRLDEMHCFLKHRWPYHEHRDSRLDSFALGACAIEATQYLTKDIDPILARMKVEDCAGFRSANGISSLVRAQYPVVFPNVPPALLSRHAARKSKKS